MNILLLTMADRYPVLPARLGLFELPSVFFAINEATQSWILGYYVFPKEK